MSDCCGGCGVDTAALQARQRRALGIVLAINVATFLMMATASFFSGSSSLLSGTLDNLGDAVTYAVSFAVVGASAAAKAKVALLKGVLILGAALAVAGQIAWHVSSFDAPVVEIMGVAAILNLAANAVCLYVLTPFRGGDVNMSSVWECSRNDVAEGLAVIAAAVLVWAFGSGWPDIVVAIALLVLFLGSAARVLRSAWVDLHPAPVLTKLMNENREA